MDGQVSFDTINEDEDHSDIEGCYRVDQDEWKVFYFTHHIDGETWFGDPLIRKDIPFESGILGIDVVLSAAIPLNNQTVVSFLSKILCIYNWSIVQGPDSLKLK